MNTILNFIKQKKLFLASIFIIIVLFALDILTKRIAFEKVDNLYQKTSGIYNYIEITSFFNIVKVINYGVSFGLFNNLKYGQLILSILTILIISFVIYLLWKTNKKYNMIIYSLIIGGGLGNLYDRITFGGVFDFLDFHIKSYHWPAFNLADSLICVGVAMLIFEDLLNLLKK